MTTSPTPILDRLAPVPPPRVQPTPSPKSRHNKVIAVGVVLLMVIGIASLDATFADLFSGKAPFLTLLWTLVVCPILLGFLVVVIHELGHLIAGWVVGYRLVSIRFGPIEITPPFRVSLTRDRRPGASGLTRMVPVSVKGIRIRTLVMILGGPAANLVAAFSVLLLVPTVSTFLGWFALVSMLVGVCNLIPFRRLSTFSDGKRILMLVGRSRRGERSLAMMRIAVDMRNGIAPEDIRPEFISRAIAFRDDSADTLLAHMVAYAASWHTATAPETGRLLEISLQYSNFAPPQVREALFCDAGVFQARKNKNVDLAREWLADITENPLIPGLRLRVEGAILEAQEDFPGALHKLDELERAVGTRVDRPQRALALRSLQRWRAELVEKAQASQTTAPAQ